MLVFWCCFCFVGIAYGRMELCGWGLKRNDDEDVFASESVDEERTKRCFYYWNWMMESLEWYRARSFVSSVITERVLRTSLFTWEEWKEEWREMVWLLWRKECDFSSVEYEMKNGEWRDADSSWVEFESRDPFHLLHAFSLPFFMIRGASNAYPPCG